MIRLRFESGSIIAEGGSVPQGKYDPSIDAYRAPAFHYREIVESLEERGIEYSDEASEIPICPELSSGVELRDYQSEALDAWKISGCRGLIVLPTGAGKTVIALKAIEDAKEAALVIVPTLVLVDQWESRLRESFGAEVGVVGGGRNTVECLTVTTYDSASQKVDTLGNRFRLLIFDEVHHLPAPTFQRIAEMYIAPHRLGLTATLERGDGSHLALTELVGEKVYEMKVDDLVGTHLSDYTIETVQVPLTMAERSEYEVQFSVYRAFIKSRGIRMRSPRDFQRFVMRSGVDPAARRALLARNRAMYIALNSQSKTSYLKDLLLENPDEKAIVFTQHNSLVYRISREMLMPAITHQTPQEEREEILRKFRSGAYRRVVTSRVLDEGVDVPDASLAVILSGTGSSRSFIQRLGRVLRKQEGKKAKLIELVSSGTAEIRLSRRRKGY